MKELTEVRVREIIESDVVSLDDAWQWIGYASKQKAFDKLKRYFEEGYDFNLNQTVKQVQHQGGLRNQTVKQVIMTKDVFKEFCMIANTAKGREIRRYFIEIEKRAMQITNISDRDKALQLLQELSIVQERRLSALEENQAKMMRSYGKRVLTPQISGSDKLSDKITEIEKQVSELKQNYYPVPKPLGPRSRRERGMWQDRYDNY
jgi:phage anti-repressor protein